MDGSTDTHIATLVHESEWDDLMNEIKNKHGEMPIYLQRAVLKTATGNPESRTSSQPNTPLTSPTRTIVPSGAFKPVDTSPVTRDRSKSHSGTGDPTLPSRQRSGTCLSSDKQGLPRHTLEPYPHSIDFLESIQLRRQNSRTKLNSPSSPNRPYRFRARSYSHPGPSDLVESSKRIRQYARSPSRGFLDTPIRKSKSHYLTRTPPEETEPEIREFHPDTPSLDGSSNRERLNPKFHPYMVSPQSRSWRQLGVEQRDSPDILSLLEYSPKSQTRSDSDNASTSGSPRDSSPVTTSQSETVGKVVPTSPDRPRSPGDDSGCSVGSMDEDEEDTGPRRSEYFRKMEADIKMIMGKRSEISSSTVSMTKEFIYAFDLIEDIKYMTTSSVESLHSGRGSQELKTPVERRRLLFRRNSSSVPNTKGACDRAIQKRGRTLFGESPPLTHGKSVPVLPSNQQIPVPKKDLDDPNLFVIPEPIRVLGHSRSRSLDMGKKTTDEWLENVQELAACDSFAEIVRQQNDDFVANVMRAGEAPAIKLTDEMEGEATTSSSHPELLSRVETSTENISVIDSSERNSIEPTLVVERSTTTLHSQFTLLETCTPSRKHPTPSPSRPIPTRHDESDSYKDSSLVIRNLRDEPTSTPLRPGHSDPPSYSHSPIIADAVDRSMMSLPGRQSNTLSGLGSPRLARFFRRWTSNQDQERDGLEVIGAKSSYRETDGKHIRSLPSSRSTSPTRDSYSEERSKEESPRRKKSWFHGFGRSSGDEKNRKKETNKTRWSFDEKRTTDMRDFSWIERKLTENAGPDGRRRRTLSSDQYEPADNDDIPSYNNNHSDLQITSPKKTKGMLRRSVTLSERKSKSKEKDERQEARVKGVNSPRYMKLMQMLTEERATEL